MGKKNPVEKWLGINKFPHLLQMLCLPNEAALKVACPDYEVMALTPKAFKIEKPKDDIDTNIVTHKKKYTTVVLSDAHFSNFAILRSGRISDGSVTVFGQHALVGRS